ncbi:uncharacterized protein N7515_008617 [Penicillium bovifimosum]|uniref:Uncharacterized protein n=1 Tax=Penicillium bovifimosum TaxID=126998 RepID=A0A9W9GNM1_9EURO|nr:uncharacterized protein N7515_008617 [Penicillium bovifimosum]KAJ5124792.1 hypothetical protein N7515_008617 [Penicillium bovifimosum]
MADTYLSQLAIADLIKTYEKDPTPENVINMVQGLVDYAFYPKDKWAIKQFADKEKNHHNYFVMKEGDNGKTLHTIIKISLDPTAAYDNQWDLLMPMLDNAPMATGRCWGILVRGLKVRLYEYHRDEPKSYRMVTCDFKIGNKSTHSVNIRKDPKVFQTVLRRIPTYLPEPWDDALTDRTKVNTTSEASTGRP